MKILSTLQGLCGKENLDTNGAKAYSIETLYAKAEARPPRERSDSEKIQESPASESGR
jgi:hypothetical protein